MRPVSPLRYPGGKARMAPVLAHVLDNMRAAGQAPTTWVEPFAGGAGAGLTLLVGGHVDHLVLGEVNSALAAFWRVVTSLEAAAELCERIRAVPVDIPTWHAQRRAYLSGQGDDLERAMAVFYLSRTNHSGILGARPIGGLEQKGRWKIDARFNKTDLIGRIRGVAAVGERISVVEADAADTITATGEDSLMFVDPPYIKAGPTLYEQALDESGHARLAQALVTSRAPWLLTYDGAHFPFRLYEGTGAHFTRLPRFSHAAWGPRLVEETLVASRQLRCFVPASF